MRRRNTRITLAGALMGALLVTSASAESPVAPTAESPANAEASAAAAPDGDDATAAPARPAPTGADGEKVMSGMSIVGNDEAPKSLVIVPWKSSELGGTLDVARALDDGRQPVDREVFVRELDYYEIRAGGGGAPASPAP